MPSPNSAHLPTHFGNFWIIAFPGDHVALIKGKVRGGKGVLVRIHSECLTGDVFGSLKCDCRKQLEEALQHIAEKKCGILLYLRQEGRGIGLFNKIRAYHLQEKGFDTVEANKLLGFDGDARDYKIAVRMLKSLGVSSIKLMTNNPEKIDSLKKNGISVERVPLLTKPNNHNKEYLDTKKRKLGHVL